MKKPTKEEDEEIRKKLAEYVRAIIKENLTE